MNNDLIIVEEFLNMIQSTKNLSDKTITAYRSDLNDFTKFGDCEKYNETTILKYVQHLMHERKLKDSSIQRKLIVLKMYFEYLFSRNNIAQNYYLTQTFKFKKEKRLPKTLSIKEVSKLLFSLNQQKDEANTTYAIWKATRNLSLIDILISTGIRIAELSNISLDDIIVAERVILIHGKGRKQRLIYISCQQTWTNLKKWLTIRNNSPTHTDKVFVNRYGYPLSIHGIEYIYKTIASEAGLQSQSTPHYLRHTFATNLLANGADLRSVQEILGHASVSTTEIYTEVTTKRKKQVLNKFNYRNKL